MKSSGTKNLSLVPSAGLLAVLITLCSLLTSCLFERPINKDPMPKAIAGILDLRSWDFIDQGIVQLEGEWEFVPGKLATQDYFDPLKSKKIFQYHKVPDFWSTTEAGGKDGQGAGTYHLKVLMPQKKNNLAIRYITLATAFELDVNQVPLAHAGRPGLTPKTSTPSYHPGYSILNNTSEVMEITVRVSNHEYRTGGMWRSLALGTLQQVRSEKEIKDMLSLIFFGGIFSTALIFLFFFFFRPKEVYHLFFALFAFVVSLRPLVTGEYLLASLFPQMPYDTMIRIEYITANFAPYLGILFFISFFAITKKAYLFTIPYLPLMLLDFIVPLPILTRTIYILFPLTSIAVLSLCGLSIYKVIKTRIPGRVIILVGGLILTTAVINDILYSSFLIYTGNMIPYALAIFIFMQAAALARRFTQTFDKVQVLSAQLGSTNEKLQNQITVQRDVQKNLEKLLKEREILVKEVHHRVKNSLQIVSSFISLQERREKNTDHHEVYTTIKNRIRAISLAHEKLYTLESLEQVELNSYISDLTQFLFSSFGNPSETPALDIEPRKINISIEFAIDMGLILTELVVNAFKFSQNKMGIQVSLHQIENEVELLVQDNGPGFPPGFKPEESKSLGFKVVLTLLTRHHGQLNIEKNQVEVLFPLQPGTTLGPLPSF